MANFNIGDVVKLKGIEGPDCVVYDVIVDDGGIDRVGILWFDANDRLREAIVDFRILLKEEKERPSGMSVIEHEMLKKPLQRNELDQFSKDNWNKIPKEKRDECLVALRLKVSEHMLDTWRKQLARGERIGSEDFDFHFNVGMQVRNLLRTVMKDNDLPPVEYENGIRYKNWDDFYMGALEDLVSQ